MTSISTFPGLLLALTLATAAAVGCGSSTGTTGTTGGSGGNGTSTGTTGTTTGNGGNGGGGGNGTSSSSTGGGGAGGGACVPGKSVTFGGDVYPILQSSCSGVEGCHHLLLQSPANAIAWLVNKPSAQCDDGRILVVPGKPEGSYLVDKLRDQNLCPDTVPMPKSGLAGPWKPLPEAQIQTFADWICAGAKND